MSARRKHRFSRREKGITPIIAIVILLLITIAIAGVAYTFITGVVTNTASSAVLFTGASCGQTGQVIMYFSNLATDPISIPSGGGGSYPVPSSSFSTPTAAPTIAQYRYEGAGTNDDVLPGNILNIVNPGAVVFGSAAPAGQYGQWVRAAGSTTPLPAAGSVLLATSQTTNIRPTSITIEAWVNFDNVPPTVSLFYPIVSNTNDGYVVNQGYIMGVSTLSGTEQLFFTVGGALPVLLDISSLAGWHYVAASYDETTGLLQLRFDTGNLLGVNYISATKSPAGPIPYSPASSYFTIGSSATVPTLFTGAFNGYQIDEVRISSSSAAFGTATGGSALCAGQGTQTVQCGNLVIANKNGKNVNVQLSGTVIQGGGTFSITDTVACSGKCDYDIVYNGRLTPVSKVC